MLASTDLLFPMSTSDVYSAIEDVVGNWKLLGLSLDIPPSTLEAIDINFHKVEDKKIELIQTWMTSKSMPTWSVLAKALLSHPVDRPAIAEKISQHQSKYTRCDPEQYEVYYAV